MNPNSEIEPKLDDLLKTLRGGLRRDSQTASHARDLFLLEAKKIAPKASRISASAPTPTQKWTETLKLFLFGARQQKPVFNLYMTIILVLLAVFGGGVTTVAAAQTALPNETLYPVKTWSEDVRLNMENDPQAKLSLAFEYITRRADEIQSMFTADNAIPEKLITRFENQQQQLLELAVVLPDSQAIPALERISDQALRQEKMMSQINVQDQTVQQMRVRIQAMLQTQEQIAQHGIKDPGWLRQRGRNRVQFPIPTSTSTVTTLTTIPFINPMMAVTPTPGSGYGSRSNGSQNPLISGTTTPGSGYGSGRAPVAACTNTPGAKNGNPGQKPGSGNGQGGGGNGNGNGKP